MALPSPSTPYRQIRARFDSDTITVYQAYPSTIAIPAVANQKLDASPNFSVTRMTWIKPSWAWMLYRSGYSYKDQGQAHILALRMKQSTFLGLLRNAVLSHHSSVKEAKSKGEGRTGTVRVQWDPERTLRLEKLSYRSIQIGVPAAHVKELMDGIVEIEDVTQRVRELKSLLDEDVDGRLTLEDLIQKGLAPREAVFEVDEDLRRILEMDEQPTPKTL
ncbi:uncharacterized protein EI97DRAFT_31748 [Westerdykella ornata]|uniref:ATP-dependent RNA helicase DHX8 n=1 Tax=Westerdykella ornata TaxID=318751 RepID=A0A6A6K070_WESOR|nr:uncharacterized protein EI97DRAFT_31748 [Westerdykella ornata]KAF2281518.1 hypothetical protein EI97DRAFT_31748 [Westerdykella ornata]